MYNSYEANETRYCFMKLNRTLRKSVWSPLFPHETRYIIELSGMSPSVSTPISSAFPPPYPLFQWCPQSKEILLNLGMKCWNSAFNAQGLKSNYSNRTGRRSENRCSRSAGAQEKGNTGWNSVYHQNWWKN
jgi:hypothetical protein